MIPDQLRIQPGQEALTPEQEREAERFAEARIAAQLPTELVDEAETEALLQEAYAVAGLPPPTRIRWVDGPLQLVAALASPSRMVRNQTEVDASLEDSREQSLLGMVWSSICNSIEDFVWNLVWNSIELSVTTRVWYGVGYSIEADVVNTLRTSGGNDLKEGISEDSVRAYYEAWWLVCARFFAVYLTPNEAQALAHFNERVSGYWLGREEAILVRRPRVLSLDAASRLHSETGKCLEYRDGWGFYAWHGVRVPERVILSPETLTREDFLNERNVEVRSVMQERMGERFVAE